MILLPEKWLPIRTNNVKEEGYQEARISDDFKDRDVWKESW